VASTLFLLALSTVPICSLASRSSVYKVEADDMSGRSLRGNGPTRRRLRVPDLGRAIKDESNPERFSDASVLGMIENRKNNAIDAIRHADELLLALRFSMEVDTSMSPAPVSALHDTHSSYMVE
jgi:hypothetical protein